MTDVITTLSELGADGRHRLRTELETISLPTINEIPDMATIERLASAKAGIVLARNGISRPSILTLRMALRVVLATHDLPLEELLDLDDDQMATLVGGVQSLRQYVQQCMDEGVAVSTSHLMAKATMLCTNLGLDEDLATALVMVACNDD